MTDKKKVTADDVFNFIRSRGPTLAMKVASNFSIDSAFAGAFLSELTSANKLLVSKVTVGRSRLYYTPDKAGMLSEYVKNLNEKDGRAANRLRDNKVLLDNIETPLIRVCLRNITDFAKPFEVFIGNQKYLFWKWLNTSNEEAKSIAVKILEDNNIISKPKPAPKEETIKNKEEDLKSEDESIPSVKVKAVEQEENGKVKDYPVSSKKTNEALDNKKEEKQDETNNENSEPKKEIQKTLTEKKEEDNKKESVDNKKIETKTLSEKESALLNELKSKSNFFRRVGNYLERNEITIIETKDLRKGKDAELKMCVPTAFGDVTFFAKLRDKKNFNHGDISEAVLRAKSEKLPLIIIISGNIAKKALELYEITEEKNKLYKSKEHHFNILIK